VSDRFDEIVGPVDDPAERERLRRAHELLLQADAPPEVTPELAAPPAPVVRLVPRRRAFTLAAAAAVLAFGLGWYGASRDPGPGVDRTIVMQGTERAPDAQASIEVLEQDEAGNWPMVLNVHGLEPSAGREDSYELWLTKDGELADSCGVFTVHEGITTVTLSVPYRFRNYDGWVVTRHGDDEILLTT
jgi:hypothetical protein